MSSNSMHLNGDENDVGYVCLPSHPGKGTANCVAKSISMRDLFLELDREDLLKMLLGTDIILDQNKDGNIIGIEILT